MLVEITFVIEFETHAIWFETLRSLDTPPFSNLIKQVDFEGSTCSIDFVTWCIDENKIDIHIDPPGGSLHSYEDFCEQVKAYMDDERFTVLEANTAYKTLHLLREWGYHVCLPVESEDN